MEAEPLDEGGDSLLKFFFTEDMFSVVNSPVCVEDAEELLLLLIIRHSEAHGKNISGLLLGGFVLRLCLVSFSGGFVLRLCLVSFSSGGFVLRFCLVIITIIIIIMLCLVSFRGGLLVLFIAISLSEFSPKFFHRIVHILSQLLLVVRLISFVEVDGANDGRE